MGNAVELREFLDFLSASCKVNVGEDSEKTENFNENDLDELTSNVLIKRLFDDAECASSTATKGNAESHVSSNSFNEIISLLKGKLSELLNEGMFDSVLSYITPKENYVNSKFNIPSVTDGNENKSLNTTKRKREKKKRVTDTKNPQQKNEVEVEIQVYEEDEGLKKKFKCPQNVLVSSMPYFSEINKGRKLEEMDIMVHCEIATFDWLMKWVKRNSLESENTPKLNFKNVISIMLLANFLKMKPLFQDCLRFCKKNMNNVIEFTPNLSCLPDGVLKKLADLFDNIEVQSLTDEEDRIKSRLFAKFVKSLREVEPAKNHGHYSSCAHLYSCSNCSKLVNRFSGSRVPCRIQYITVRSNGDVLFKHSRDSTWNIDDHIKSIWMEYKNWSFTYWRLWSQCHFLHCNNCYTVYAVAFSNCCPYHPQPPYFHQTEQSQTLNSLIDDTGQYPCCGSRAIRNKMVKIHSGCKLRSHDPKLLTNDDNHVQAIVDKFPELIKLKYTENESDHGMEDGNDVENLDILLRKAAIEKNEHDINQGLLNGPLFDSHLKVIKKFKSASSWEYKKEESCNMKNPENNRFDDLETESTSAGESENSDLSSYDFFSPRMNKSEIVDTATLCANIPVDESKQVQNELKPVWTSRYPNRFYNEDNQRDYEEVAFHAMITVLLQCNDKQKSSSGDTNCEYAFPYGGSYAKIESEWKEARLTTLGSKFNKS